MKTTEICGRLDENSDAEEVLYALRVLAKMQIMQETATGWRTFGLVGSSSVDPDTRQIRINLTIPE